MKIQCILVLGSNKNGLFKINHMSKKEKNIPIILSEGKYTTTDISKLKKEVSIWKTKDIYEIQLEELFEITHPAFIEDTQKKERFMQERLSEKDIRGDWIYYPWSGMLVHTVNKCDYWLLRTNRNQNLITKREQEKLRNFTVGIVGLSVGSHTAVNLAYCGIANSIKLAEYDTLDTTNLNRVRARMDQIGESKIDITRQQVYEMNPYADLISFEEGLSGKNLHAFITKDPAPKIIFEIIDNFEMKIKLRVAARKARIPVVMFSNLGDSILVDIERYDVDVSTPLFNGRAGSTPEEIVNHPDVTDGDKNKYAVDLVGVENVPKRAMESVREIGKTLVGRPQLMSTVSISGGLGSYITRQIALNKEMKGGRFLVKFGDLFYH